MAQVATHHHHRHELLRLLLTCFSDTIYHEAGTVTNTWVQVGYISILTWIAYYTYFEMALSFC